MSPTRRILLIAGVFFVIAFIPPLGALALLGVACLLILRHEAIRYREHRARLRHPELAE